MRALRLTLTAAFVTLAAACTAARQPPVRVAISPADLSRLAGEWSGEYSSATTGRSGSIVFHLTAGADSAHGDVVMVPRATGIPLQRAMLREQPNVQPAQAQALTIRFARFEGDRVTGAMDRYVDPDCNCPVSTTFEGTVRGNRIEGIFNTFGAPTGHPVTGRWSVERKP